jgi:drug/metabolite transporter (DMT)-like permease
LRSSASQSPTLSKLLRAAKLSRPLALALAAVFIWSSLALAGATLNDLPPFLLLAAAFCTSGLLGLGYSLLRSSGSAGNRFNLHAWMIPTPTLLVGVGGIFGYHYFYFRAFAIAPAVEVNLINYLWPLLIVVLSPVLVRGVILRPRHILGALLGLSGAALIATGGRLNLDARFLPGYLLAAAAALTWAVYSLLTRRLPPFPSEAVGLFCLISGLLALGLQAASPGGLTVVTRLGSGQWLGLILAGLGPMGAAFYFWDAALKRGDPRAIGSLAYLTPLLSTLNLVIFTGKTLSGSSLAAMALIIAGALVGSWGN